MSHAFQDGAALLRAADAAEREGRRREAFALRDAANDQLAVSADIRRAFARGQLSAIRADVAHYVGWCERRASTLEVGPPGWHIGAAWLRAQAADCRRWLEATR